MGAKRSPPKLCAFRHRRGESLEHPCQADAVSQETAQRITNHLQEAVKAPRDDGSAAFALRRFTTRGVLKMKVIVIGSLSAAANIFGLYCGVILED